MFKLFLFSCTLLMHFSVLANNFVTADLASHSSTNQQGHISNTFLEDEPISTIFTLNIPKSEIGHKGELFLVAKDHGRYYMLDEQHKWRRWNGQFQTLLPYRHVTLQQQETLSVLNEETLIPGEYLAYVGFRNQNQDIVYDAKPATLFVFASENTPLQAMQHAETLYEFLDNTTNPSAVYNDFLWGISDFSPPPAPARSENTSGTNLQETGVDEADRIKVNGKHLFALQPCDNTECLVWYEINENPPEHKKITELAFDNAYGNSRIYFFQNTQDEENDYIIRIASQSRYSYGLVDSFIPPAPTQAKSTVQFIAITADNKLQIESSYTFDGELNSSRVVNNSLYLITQFNSADHFPQPEEDKKEDATLPELPMVVLNQQNEKPLVDPNNCYITPRNSGVTRSSSLLSIIQIPLHTPESFQNTCIAGAVESIYASTQSLYLASTRYHYEIDGNSLVYPGDPNYYTDLHKFAFTESGLQYRASGRVTGHLGWEEDKKSFRMGEYQDTLRIATSSGQTWDNTATTRVSVLTEDEDKQLLKETAILDKLGKPGERLYAARFIGNRGFLVTFKVTDPLILIDFSTPEKPEVLGELEIAGYSDYIHIINENYILGIGKDAIADKNEQRGAWYQGLKLSLFDVSQPDAMFEVNNIIIGKRGTNSALLQDHHALAWLPGQDDEADKLAIPVNLHENTHPNSLNPEEPWYFYDWTHSGLYTFTINTTDDPGITLNGKLLTAERKNGDPQPYDTYNDRSVIQGNTVHYVHGDQLLSESMDALQ